MKASKQSSSMISASVSPTLNSSLAFLSDGRDWDTPPPQLLAMVLTTTTEGELGQQEGCSAAAGLQWGPHVGRRASEC